MDNSIEKLLAPRVLKNCVPLFKDGYFEESARKAMLLVEIALKEKGKFKDRNVKKFGKNMIKELFKGAKIILRVPLGEELQDQAQEYFSGVFSYYRNYLMHEVGQIDEKIALRILIIASELLELIDASDLTLKDLEDIEGLVQIGEFKSVERLRSLLTLLNNYDMPESSYDALYEALTKNGFVPPELESAFALNLVEMHSEVYNEETKKSYVVGTETIEWITLTKLGQEVLDKY